MIEGDTGGTPVPPFDYKEIKRRFGGIVIANNGFDKARANQAIAQGRADLVAFGKPFISNPDLVTRLYLDAPLNACQPRDLLWRRRSRLHRLSAVARGRAACLLLRRRRAGLGVMFGGTHSSTLAKTFPILSMHPPGLRFGRSPSSARVKDGFVQRAPPINFRRVPNSTRLTSGAPQPPEFHAASGDVDRSAPGDARWR